MRTNDLRKLVQTKLKTLTTNVYYEVASNDAMYPHAVLSFDQIDLGDLSRQDYILNVDVWDKGNSMVTILNLCDSIENLLQAQNLPQENVLPTFYLVSRKTIPDADKSIRHQLIRFQIQN